MIRVYWNTGGRKLRERAKYTRGVSSDPRRTRVFRPRCYFSSEIQTTRSVSHNAGWFKLKRNDNHVGGPNLSLKNGGPMLLEKNTSADQVSKCRGVK